MNAPRQHPTAPEEARTAGSQLRTAIGTAAGSAGEWMHYVAAVALVNLAGGIALVAIYLVVQALPSFVIRGRFRSGGILAPLGVAALVYRPGSIPVLLGAAVLIGAGNGAAGRPAAWLTGLLGAPRWWGVGGAVAGLVLGQTRGSVAALSVAGVLFFAATVFGEEHELRGPMPLALSYAGLSVAVFVGMRVMEPEIVADPSAASFFGAAWALGAQLGWRWARQADRIAVLIAPFAAAAAYALIPWVQGPGLLFLYSGAAAAVTVVLGTRADAEADRRYRPVILLPGVLSGVAWTLAGRGLAMTAWVASAIVVLGAVATVLAVRVDSEEPSTDVDTLEPTPPSEELERMAAAALLQSLREARQVRQAALRRYRDSKTDPISAASANVTEICREALAAAKELELLLQDHINQKA